MTSTTFDRMAVFANHNAKALEEVQQGKVFYEPIEKIVPNPLNVLQPSEVDEMEASIEEFGILQPLVVTKQDGEIRLIAGHNRLAAVKRLIREGKDYYYFGKRITGSMPVIEHDRFEDWVAEKKTIIAANCQRNMTKEKKGKVIDACLEIIQEERKRGTKEKGRTAFLVSQMTGIPEFFVKNYLAEKNRTASVDLTAQEKAAEYDRKTFKRICNRMRNLSSDIDSFNWDSSEIDEVEVIKAANKLIRIMENRLFERGQNSNGEETD